MQTFPSLRRAVALMAFGSLALTGCGSDDSSGPDSTLASSIISQISIVGANGTVTFRNEDAPEGGAGGPAATVNVQGSAVVGGTTQVRVTAPNAFQRIIVALADSKGYYEINLNSATTVANLALAIGQDVELTELLTRIAVAAAGGSLGAYDEAEIEVITSVGTGDVQVSVSWNSDADVDLYVTDPSGEEIYYGNPQGDNGELDLDSNAGCDLDNVRNENITFASPAPRGTYSFYVDLWSACGTSSTNWVVTVRRKGQPAQTYTGSFGSSSTSSTPVTFTY